MLTVGNFNTVQFKGTSTPKDDNKNTSFGTANSSYAQQPEKQVPVQKTHAGLIAGSIAGIFDSFITFFESGLLNFTKNAAEGQLDNVIKARNPIISGLMALGGSIACGTLVDSITNKRREKFAQESVGKTPKEILRTNDRADVTSAGEVYCKSNAGKVYGTMLGVLLNSLLSIRHLGFNKSLLTNAPVGAIRGLIMGAIADGCSNKAIRKFTDKNAIMQDSNQEIQ